MKEVDDPGWPDRAPLRFERTGEIAAPPSEVFAVLADHAGWPDWFTSLKSVEVTGQPSGVGARRRVKVRFPPLTVDERFIAWDDSRRFSFTATRVRPPIARTLVEDIRLEEVSPGRTRVIYLIGIVPARGLGWASGLLRAIVNRSTKNAVKQLKGEVESV